MTFAVVVKSAGFGIGLRNATNGPLNRSQQTASYVLSRVLVTYSPSVSALGVLVDEVTKVNDEIDRVLPGCVTKSGEEAKVV